MQVKISGKYIHKVAGALLICTAIDPPESPGSPSASLKERVAWFRFVNPPQRTPEYIIDISIPESLWDIRLIEVTKEFEDDDPA